MPDYALCNRDDCPKKHSCARYMGKPSVSHQSYIQPIEVPCELYWEIDDNVPFELVSIFDKEKLWKR